MCVRFSPLTAEDAQAVLDVRNSGRHRHVLADECEFDPVYDARPGSTVAVYVPGKGGSLVVSRLEWGFTLDGKQHAVFNTRIESALEQLRRGRRDMWAKAIAEGRCLVPVRAFYEGHMTERVASPLTGRPIKRQYRFRLPGARAFLLAAIQSDGCFSIVTTAPNACVAPIHNRMPLALGPGESSVWLGPKFACLANRSKLTLEPRPEA